MIDTALQHDDRVPAQASGAARPRVLVRYEPSPAGGAAVLWALDVTRASSAELVVLTIATQERVDVGCASCRQSASIWNREMRSIAAEELAEAAAIVGRRESVEYQVLRGQPRVALREAADACQAAVIVLASESGPLGRRRVSRLADGLRRDGPWQVTVAAVNVAA